MSGRTFLWVLFGISIAALIAAGAGLIYYYPGSDTDQASAAEEVQPTPVQPEPEPEPEPEPAPEPEPEPEPEPAPEPEPEPQPDPRDDLADKDFYYWLLVAEADSSEEAEEVVDQLGSYDLDARIHVQGSRYEVRVGPYDAVEEAEFTASRVEALDFIESVRIKIVLNR